MKLDLEILIQQWTSLDWVMGLIDTFACFLLENQHPNPTQQYYIPMSNVTPCTSMYWIIIQNQNYYHVIQLQMNECDVTRL